MRPCVAITAAALLIAGCATTPTKPATTAAAPLAITSVGVEPKTVELSAGHSATIRYELTQPARITVDLVDEEGRVVRRLETGKQSASRHTVTWDARGADGQPVPSGVYRYIINAYAVDRGPTTVDSIYDPSSSTGGEELQVERFTFDQPSGRLQWLMPKAGYARLRIGVQGFPHLRTLLDWAPLEAGEQSLVWDGLDDSGLIKLADHPHVSIKLHAFALPWNTIIVKNQNAEGSRQKAEGSMNATYPPLFRSDAAYLHARHSRGSCHEVGLRVEFPDRVQYDKTGRPLLAGTVPVRVALAQPDASQLVNSRFEVAIFEDTTILFEEEDGTSPFTYVWDTGRLPPGPHLLTVNILGYHDHFGVLTVPVMVEKSL